MQSDPPRRSLSDADYAAAHLVLANGDEVKLARCRYKLEVTPGGIVCILVALEAVAARQIEAGDLFMFPWTAVSSLYLKPARVERPALVVAGKPN